MKNQISKDILEGCLNAMEFAVRDSYPGNSKVVNNLNEIMRLALIGHELEKSGHVMTENQVQPDRSSANQMGIR